MTDFKKLAADYMLADDPARKADIVAQAAHAIKNDPRDTNPLSQCVQSIGAWIGVVLDDHMDDGEGNTEDDDLIARAKALEFLARTLDHLENDQLTRKQVKLLTTFFGAMLGADPRAGVLPSVTALYRLPAMSAFTAEDGKEILKDVCKLGDDFRKQTPETRLAVYRLISLLILDPRIKNQLQNSYGPSYRLIVELLDMCRNERDPSNLMIWFQIISAFLSQYSPSPEVTEDIFSVFSNYFPISLKAPLQHLGVTSDTLKIALRGCFSAHHRVAKLAIPFLIQKLDQGDSVTINVKLDILRTLHACFEHYTNVQQGIVPFTEQVWNSLKYEIRNGEVEEVIRDTAGALTMMAKRLEGDDLQSYAQSVLRDCAEDLSNPTYGERATKLLGTIFLSSASAYALTVPQIIRLVKENLANSKSTEHVKQLLVLTNAMVETRLEVFGPSISDASLEAAALKSTDQPLTKLFEDIYLPQCVLTVREDPFPADPTIKVKVALRGIRLLVAIVHYETGKVAKRLVPDSVCTSICNFLGKIILQPAKFLPEDLAAQSRLAIFFDFVPDAVETMQALARVFPEGCKSFVTELIQAAKTFNNEETPSWFNLGMGMKTNERQECLNTILRWGSFVSCRELPALGEPLDLFLHLLTRLLRELDDLMTDRRAPQNWSSYISAVHFAYMHILDACIQESLGTKDWTGDAFQSGSWDKYIHTIFPMIPTIDGEMHTEDENGSATLSLASHEPIQRKDTQMHIQIIGLYIVRLLYRRATTLVEISNEKGLSLALSRTFDEIADNTKLHSYWTQTGNLARSVLGSMSASQQLAVMAPEECFTLFRGGDVFYASNSSLSGKMLRDSLMLTKMPTAASPMVDYPEFPLKNLVGLPTPCFFPQMLEAFHPETVKELFKHGAGMSLMLSSLLCDPQTGTYKTKCLNQALSILSNKFPVEQDEELASLLQRLMDYAWEKEGSEKVLTEQLLFIRNAENASRFREKLPDALFAIVAGILRRYTGRELGGILKSIFAAVGNTKVGHRFARKIGDVFEVNMESLHKEDHAIIKPLWKQRTYVELLQPMLSLSWPTNNDSLGNSDEKLVAGTYSLAVIRAVSQMEFAVYENDAEQLIRIIICFYRNLPFCEDVLYALRILETIVSKVPDATRPFLKSIIEVCMDALRTKTYQEIENAAQKRGWMPRDFVLHDRKSESDNGDAIRKAALGILHVIRSKHDTSLLKEHTASVNRGLSLASGNHSREVRKLAMSARIVWSSETGIL